MDRAGGKRKENLVVSLFSCQLLRSFPPFIVFLFFVFQDFSCSSISFLSRYLALAFSHLKCPWSAAMLANVTWWKGGISSNFFFLLFSFFFFFASLPSLAHSHPLQKLPHDCALCKWMAHWCNGQYRVVERGGGRRRRQRWTKSIIQMAN